MDKEEDKEKKEEMEFARGVEEEEGEKKGGREAEGEVERGEGGA